MRSEKIKSRTASSTHVTPLLTMEASSRPLTSHTSVAAMVMVTKRTIIQAKKLSMLIAAM